MLNCYSTNQPNLENPSVLSTVCHTRTIGRKIKFVTLLHLNDNCLIVSKPFYAMFKTTEKYRGSVKRMQMSDMGANATCE